MSEVVEGDVADHSADPAATGLPPRGVEPQDHVAVQCTKLADAMCTGGHTGASNNDDVFTHNFSM